MAGERVLRPGHPSPTHSLGDALKTPRQLRHWQASANSDSAPPSAGHRNNIQVAAASSEEPAMNPVRKAEVNQPSTMRYDRCSLEERDRPRRRAGRQSRGLEAALEQLTAELFKQKAIK